VTPISGEVSFLEPHGLALDREGRVLVVDFKKNRVRGLSLPSKCCVVCCVCVYVCVCVLLVRVEGERKVTEAVVLEREVICFHFAGL